MKISVITVCLNSEKTIISTFNSVINQTYSNIEHIIVDGGSKDRTTDYIKKYKFKKKRVFFKKGLSLYDSLNFGIKKSNGELISILHSDDIYNNSNVLKNVVKKVKLSKDKVFFGDVVYFNDSNFSKVTRSYPALKNTYQNFKFGNMPPHTGSFYKKEIFNKYGYYNAKFKIAADFDHLLKIIFLYKEKFTLLNLLVVRMKSGGLSSKNLNSFITINKEILNSFKLNGIKTNFFKIMLRIPPKIFQYIFLKQKTINKDFIFKINKNYEDYYYNKINIMRDIKKINFKKNFILSALNLAFLGSLADGKIKLNKNLINWPDGIFSIFSEKKLSKIPGRQVLKDLNLNKKYIKRIIVLGNLSKKGKFYLQSRFKTKIFHKELPFGDINQITKNLKISIKKNDLIFLTLPTPKQEQIADYLKNNNKFYKIICIGGSIAIASGDEKEVPKFLFYFEFLWRLRYESFRRFKRLISTFYLYTKDILFRKNIKNIKIKLLN
jgi:glycosyltransferase involved in cell wall biosynthesis